MERSEEGWEPLGSWLELLSDGVALYRGGAVLRANEAFLRLAGMGPPPVEITLPTLLEKLGIDPGARDDGGNFSSLRLRLRTVPVDGGEDGLFLVLQHLDLLAAIDEGFANNPYVEECLRFMLHNPYEGINIVDREGRIVYMSPAHEKFFGLPPGGAVGRFVKDVIENTRLNIVARTGIAEIGKTQSMKGHERIVVRIPLRRGGEVVGAIGKVMFKDLHQLKFMARELEILREKITDFKEKLGDVYATKYSLEDIVGESPAIREVKALVREVARTRLPVLITGESGTGKELIAQAIHSEGSQRAPFIPVNCSAIPEALVESELFGYEKGAFTGAERSGRIGKFELGEGGTVFLDEIGDMPLGSQAKLLRVLQEGEIQRVGGTRSIRVNFRLITATNRDVKSLLAQNRFREDLYYRINAIHIHVPPLRERPDDIPLLIAHVVSRFPEKFGVAPKGIHQDAKTLFSAYGWPGNVRELINVLEWSGNLAGSGEIAPEHLPPQIIHTTIGGGFLQGKLAQGLLREVVRQAEENAIVHALQIAEGNHVKAAKMLGIHRSELYRKLPKDRKRTAS